MGRKKCPFCGDYIPENELTTHKEYPKRFIHMKCLPLVKEQHKKKIEEQKELDKLVDVVAQVHNVSRNHFPKMVYMALKNLHYGNAPFDNVKMGRNLKNGFEYEVIAQCYKENQQKIRNIIRDKNFNDTGSEFKYTLMVILNHLPKIKTRIEKEKISSTIVNDRLKKLNNDEDIIIDYKERNKKKNKKVLDISDLLDKEDDSDLF